MNRTENAEHLGAAPEGSAEPLPMGSWAMIRLEQKGPNRHGIGSWVEVKSGAHIWRREVSVGGGHAGGEAGWIHVGVGTAERIEVRVQWPDGTWGPWLRTFANQFLLIRRGEVRPLYWFRRRTGRRSIQRDPHILSDMVESSTDESAPQAQHPIDSSRLSRCLASPRTS